MAKPRLTPEEQLLKLIEKPEAAQARKSLQRAWLTFRSNLKRPDLKTLNKVFLAVCILLLVYSIIDFAVNRPRMKVFEQKTESGQIKLTEEISGAQAEQPALHYVEIVKRRNAFSPISLSEREEAASGVQGLREMAEDLSLVGISWYKQEPLAMIEDKKEKKTYFLKEGDNIKSFKVKQILKNSVILSFEDETLELM